MPLKGQRYFPVPGGALSREQSGDLLAFSSLITGQSASGPTVQAGIPTDILDVAHYRFNPNERKVVPRDKGLVAPSGAALDAADRFREGNVSIPVLSVASGRFTQGNAAARRSITQMPDILPQFEKYWVETESGFVRETKKGNFTHIGRVGSFEFPSLDAVFGGSASGEGDIIPGPYSNAPHDLPFVLSSGDLYSIPSFEQKWGPLDELRVKGTADADVEGERDQLAQSFAKDRLDIARGEGRETDYRFRKARGSGRGETILSGALGDTEILGSTGI